MNQERNTIITLEQSKQTVCRAFETFLKVGAMAEGLPLSDKAIDNAVIAFRDSLDATFRLPAGDPAAASLSQMS